VKDRCYNTTMSKAQQAAQKLGHGRCIDCDMTDVPATHRHAIRAIAERLSEDGGIEGRRAAITKANSRKDAVTTYVYLVVQESDMIGRSCVSTYDIKKALANINVDYEMLVSVRGRVTVHLQ